MSDIIIHDMTIDEFYDYDEGGVGYLIGTGRVDEVKHGHWEWTNDPRTGDFVCSNCLDHNIVRSRYCPSCGAKMDEVEE